MILNAKYRILSVDFDSNVDAVFVTIHDERRKTFRDALSLYESYRREDLPEPGFYRVVTLIDRSGVLLYQSLIERKPKHAETEIL